MRVAILGCGYVGLELCRQLTDRGHDAVGVRRSTAGVSAVEDAGGVGIQADVTDPDSLGEVPNADALVFAASSGGRGAEAAREIYVEGLRTVIDHFGARENPRTGWSTRRVRASTATTTAAGSTRRRRSTRPPRRPASSREAERVARSKERADRGIDGTVARYAGLYGPDRYRLDRYLDGPVTEGFLNMIHRDDAAGAVRYLLTADLARDDVVLVVDDEPVAKWAFADCLADECGVDRPPKQNEGRTARGRRPLGSGAPTHRDEQALLERSPPGSGGTSTAFRRSEGYRAAIDASVQDRRTTTTADRRAACRSRPRSGLVPRRPGVETARRLAGRGERSSSG